MKSTGMSQVMKWVKLYFFDVALLLASTLCLALFIDGSVNMNKMSGISSPLAKVNSVRGKGKKKASGSSVYEEIHPGDVFFNMDALWVGKKSMAEVSLLSGETFEVLENTLLIFKKPFHTDFTATQLGASTMQFRSKGFKFQGGAPSAGRTSMKLRVGKVRMKGQPASNDELDAAASKKGLPELPIDSGSDKQNVAKNTQLYNSIYPKYGTLIFKKETSNIPFDMTWPVAETGFLVIRNASDGTTQYVPVLNQKSISVQLPANHTKYLWQIIDNDKNLLLGPFFFNVDLLTEQSTRNLLKKGITSKTDIYF